MLPLADLKTIALAIRKIQPLRKGKKKRRKIEEKKQKKNIYIYIYIIFKWDRRMIKSLLKNVFENIDKQKVDSKQFENMTKLLGML